MNDAATQLETPRNHPEPVYDKKRIQDELVKLAGTIPYGFGKMSGKPRVKLIWGQTEKIFSAGKMRIRFWNQDVQPIFTKRAWRVTKKGFEQVHIWIKAREKKMVDAFNAKKWNEYHALLFAPIEWFLKKYVSPLEYQRLAETSSFEETARLLPEGWFYVEDLPIVEEIGMPRFFMVEWQSPHKVYDRSLWEHDRFSIQQVIDLPGKEVFVDAIGPYPTYGEYSNVIRRIEGDDGEYLQPTISNTVDILRQLLKEAERRPSQQKKSSLASASRRLESQIAREDLAFKANSEALLEKVHEEGQIVIVGKKARIFPKVNKPYHGKPTKVIKAGENSNEK